MANFQGHLYGAAVVGSLASLAVYSVGWAGPQQTQALFLLPVTGGLLPDIDSDSSRPVRGFFTLLGVVLAFWISFSLVGQLPVAGLAAVWMLVFLTVRFGVFELVARFTVHRGVWHSWLGALFASVATADIAFQFAGLSPWDAWLAGLFLGLGYFTHLVLDEAASVDLLGRRVRRSFGTALKPCSIAYPWASLAMGAALAAVLLPAPTFDPVLQAGRYYGISAENLQVRLLGEGGWLDGLRTSLAGALGYGECGLSPCPGGI
jgi:hypothetical protein